MKQYLSQKEWLSLPQETRQSLILKFAINRSECVRVVNQEIVSDGCSQNDLINGITIGKMLDFIGNDWEKVDNDALFDSLFIKVVDKITVKCVKEEKKEERKDVSLEVKELNPIQKYAQEAKIKNSKSSSKKSV